MYTKQFICILISFLMILPIFNLNPAIGEEIETIAGSILYVGPTSTYKTIQSAIDNASSGDTIIVDNGTYNESVLVNKSNINLIGNSSTKCIIQHYYVGTSSTMNFAAGINVTVNGVNITGFNITVSGNYSFGINIRESSSFNSNIFNNNITTTGNRGYGIYVRLAFSNNITNNNISTGGLNAYGIYMSPSSKNIILNNTIYTTGQNANGILLAAADNNDIRDNWINTTGTDSIGIYMSSSSDNNNITNNNVSWNHGSGIYLNNCNQNNLLNNYVQNNSNYGLYFYNADYNTMFNNTITGNQNRGIYLRTSSNYNDILSNKIKYNHNTGIYFNSNLNYNYIAQNTISNNTWDGIGLETNVNHNIITNNTISGNKHSGIILYDGTNNTIINNNISVNVASYDGIRFGEITNSSIENNNVIMTTDNGHAIRIQSNSENIKINNNSLETTGSNLHGLWLRTGSKNVTITNTSVITNGSSAHGILIQGSNNTTIIECNFTTLGTNSYSIYQDGLVTSSIDSNFNSSTDYDLYITNGGNLTVVNCSFSDLDVTNIGGGVLIVKNYLNIQCLFDDSITPISDADVLITDNDLPLYSTSGYGGTDSKTDQFGRTKPILVMDRWYNKNNNPIENITNISVKKTKDRTWEEDRTDIDMSTTHLETFISEDITKPPVPSNLMLTRIRGTNSLNLTWDPNPDTVNYTVWAIKACFWTVIANISHPKTWIIDPNLQDEMNHYYRLEAWDAVGLGSGFSNVVNFSLIDITNPKPPSNLSVRPVPNGDALNISWNLSVDDTLNYEVYVESSSTLNWIQIANITQPNTYYIWSDDSLKNGSSFRFRSRALDKVGLPSQYTPPVIGTHRDFVAPSAPGTVYAKTISDTAINVSWSASPENDVSGYYVYSTEPGGTSIGPYRFRGITTKTFYTFTGLWENAEYYYKVRSFDEANNTSPESVWAKNSTLAIPPSIPVIDTIPEYTNRSKFNITGTGEPDVMIIVLKFLNNKFDKIGDGRTNATGEFDIGIALDDGLNQFKLFAKDNANVPGSKSEIYNITYDPIIPIAAVGKDIMIAQNDLVLLNGSGSWDNYEIAHYQWSFRYNNTLQLIDGSLKLFKFEIPGNYMVTLTVIDVAGNQDTDWLWVNVTAPPKPKPKITDTIPTNESENVKINQKITINFDMSMDTVSFAKALLITPMIDFELSWSRGNKQVMITFTEDLDYAASYTIHIGSAKGSNGEILEDSPNILTFTTEAPAVQPGIDITDIPSTADFKPGDMITVSGTSTAILENTEISAFLGKQSAKGKITSNGTWSIEIQTPFEEGMYTLNVLAGDYNSSVNIYIKLPDEPVDDDDTDDNGLLGLGTMVDLLLLLILVIIIVALLYGYNSKRKRWEKDRLEFEKTDEEELDELEETEADEEEFECPDCGEMLAADVMVCESCGAEFEE